MKLLSLNTHSIIEKDYARKTESFIKQVARLQPDIIALQEVNQTATAPEAPKAMEQGRVLNNMETRSLRSDNHAAHVAAELRKKGLAYSWTWLPMKLGFDKYDEGLAIFSKRPIAETRVVLMTNSGDYDSWRTRYALGIRPEGSRDWFYTLHLGWWQDEEEPFRDQWNKLNQEIEDQCGQGRIFLLGDFNSPAEVRNEGYDLIKEAGWQDTYLLAEDQGPDKTVLGVIDGWRDKLTEEQMEQGMRIDHIWCDERVRVLSSRSCFDGAKEPVVSDHFGVLVEIK